jgi:abortive infection Abi-like protein
MPDWKFSDIRIVDEAFQDAPGYCLNFSDRTFREWFEDELKIDIDQPRYHAGGSSKMNRLRTFLRISEPASAARALRQLSEYREDNYADYKSPKTKARLFALIERLEGASTTANTDALEQFTPDETLEELISSIGRDIAADKPAAALDRLHTYCAKKFGHLLDQRNIAWTRDEPLHSRVGKYVKAVHAERPLQEMTLQILKNAIGVFDKFNQVRNNQSLAHDNDLLHKAEARFIFDSVSAVLRFVKNVDTARFEN